MPVTTSTVPATIQPVKGSPSSQTPIRMVDMGPTMPICAVRPAPMRSMAIITSSTGTAVQAVALSSESQITWGATCAADSGRSSPNCRMHSPQATLVASPTRRSEPRRRTSSPL